METQQNYYARRAVAERSAAERAADARARHAHLDLAARFDLLATAVGEAGSNFGAEEPGAHRRFDAGFIQI